VRLLYVALTRAKERLVVCGNWPERLKAEDFSPANSFLDLLAGRRPGALQELGNGGELLDAAGVPWRLAASPPRPSAGGAPPLAERAVPETPPRGATETARATIPAAMRIAARERSGRSRLARAAELAHSGGGDRT
jgi:ATP-dependent exoDNAse (exonuclease V) beta subunit